MSGRTIAAAETAIRIEKPEALWIDAFCMPLEEPARTRCLSRMGAIYGQASKVVVVLSAECSEVLEQITDSGEVDPATMLTLERDDWLTRVWTYQELVNAAKTRFVAEGGGDASVGGQDVLNYVGYAIDKYKKAQGYDSFAMRALHPRLDSLEDAVLDWRKTDYLNRSAYQVMCGMVGRYSTQPEDQFFAMIGTLIAAPEDSPADPTAHPAEYFMQVCEAKGDYSFIYSTATRCETPGKRWRPGVAENFRPVYPWTTDGEGQSGTVRSTHIQLNGMWCPAPGTIKPQAEQFVARLLQKRDAGSSVGAVPTRILRRLQQAGFSGCGVHLETESGFFYPHSPVKRTKDVLVAVATGLQMHLGAPGLVLGQDGSDLHEFRGVGLFVGPVPKRGDAIMVR